MTTEPKCLPGCKRRRAQLVSGWEYRTTHAPGCPNAEAPKVDEKERKHLWQRAMEAAEYDKCSVCGIVCTASVVDTVCTATAPAPEAPKVERSYCSHPVVKSTPDGYFYDDVKHGRGKCPEPEQPAPAPEPKQGSATGYSGSTVQMVAPEVLIQRLADSLVDGMTAEEVERADKALADEVQKQVAHAALAEGAFAFGTSRHPRCPRQGREGAMTTTQKPDEFAGLAREMLITQILQLRDLVTMEREAAKQTEEALREAHDHAQEGLKSAHEQEREMRMRIDRAEARVREGADLLERASRYCPNAAFLLEEIERYIRAARKGEGR